MEVAYVAEACDLPVVEYVLRELCPGLGAWYAFIVVHSASGGGRRDEDLIQSLLRPAASLAVGLLAQSAVWPGTHQHPESNEPRTRKTFVGTGHRVDDYFLLVVAVKDHVEPEAGAACQVGAGVEMDPGEQMEHPVQGQRPASRGSAHPRSPRRTARQSRHREVDCSESGSTCSGEPSS
jgi:hypothetical protein